MQKLYFINSFTGTPIQDIGICDLRNGHIIKFEIDERFLGTSETDCVYQAKAVVTPDFLYFDAIKNDASNVYGFRYETASNNIAFVVKDKRLLSNGRLEIDLASSITLLQETLSYIDVVDSSIPVSTILNNLDSRFIYQLISPNRIITLTTDIKNDYEILKNISRFATGWAFRENKLISQGAGLWKTQILIGNFASTDIEDYYNADTVNRAECKPDVVNNNRLIDNNLDVDQVTTTDFIINYPTAHANRVFVFGDNNQGITQNARTSLDPRIITVRPDFPLGAVTKNGQVYHYITNVNMPSFPIREKVLVYETSSNEQESGGAQTITTSLSSQRLYQFGCSYLQALHYLPNIRVENTLLKKFTLPGNVVYKSIKRDYRKQDGTIVNLIDEQNTKGITNQADAINISVITN